MTQRLPYWRQPFLKKPKILYITYNIFRTFYDFVQNISPACGSNAYQNVRRDFRLSMLASNNNLPLKLFRATVAYWHWKSKVSPCIILYVFRQYVAKFKPNRMVQNTHIFYVFLQKAEF